MIKRIIILNLITLLANWVLNAQSYSKNIADFIKKVENPYNFLSKIETLGIKMSGTTGLDSTFEWLKKISIEAGYMPKVYYFMNTTDTLYNIELVKNGTNDSSILVCAHYDSWVGKGVNDNGTGNFAVYQMAKLLKNLKSKYTIRFIFFSGEELGFKGSYDYVKRIKSNGIKVKFMLNFDQLGGTAGFDNSKVKCEKDEQSSNKILSELLTNKIANCYSIYTTLTPQISQAYLSDYIPFIDSGYIISGLYQYASYPYTHTTDDLLKNIDINTLTETVKGALAALIFLSEIKDTELVNTNKYIINNKINVYLTNGVLRFENLVGFNYKIFDYSGNLIEENIIQINIHETSVKQYAKGIYFILLQKELYCDTKKIFLH
ncbi:MAG: DUF4910 domain-containing protein [Bacteroidetes bacterium]|nr:DUF4910 domain-containing protein [Bacteroidota bacterium]